MLMRRCITYQNIEPSDVTDEKLQYIYIGVYFIALGDTKLILSMCFVSKVFCSIRY